MTSPTSPLGGTSDVMYDVRYSSHRERESQRNMAFEEAAKLADRAGAVELANNIRALKRYTPHYYQPA